MSTPKEFIKFKHRDFSTLRHRLLKELNEEHAAILLGKREVIEDYTIINIHDIIFPCESDYENQSRAFLRLKKNFIYNVLLELTNRYDVDTVVDVHTHPFSNNSVNFSGVDDRDEIDFYKFLSDKFDGLHYGSIVLSRNNYSARLWSEDQSRIVPKKALIKTQTKPEEIPSSDFSESRNDEYYKKTLSETDGFFNRSALTLGLDMMRSFMDGQVVTLVGVGGLGSILGEHLIHMGFHNINLIDNDTLEISNLNRFVGAYYDDALNKNYKVDIVRRHLESINPHANIVCYKNDVHDSDIEKVIALSDWIIVSTDNHSSRFRSQQLSIKYFVPLISVGVNITVDNGNITDMSGEVITVRVGDRLCLNCLNRINPIKIANEKHPNELIRNTLVEKGYVSGANIKEPAVKTLNSHLATMAIDILINQYTELHKHVPILIFEHNNYMTIYEDTDSLIFRNKDCFTCNI